MPATFDWDNTEDIAIALTDKYPETDPLTVRFTDMHKWAIQMAWHEEFQDRQS